MSVSGAPARSVDEPRPVRCASVSRSRSPFSPSPRPPGRDRSGRAGAGVPRAELGRRPHARRTARRRAAGDGEHHEADDSPRRARAPLARRRGHRAARRGTDRRVDARSPCRPAHLRPRSPHRDPRAERQRRGDHAGGRRGRERGSLRDAHEPEGRRARPPWHALPQSARARRAGPRLDRARHRRARSRRAPRARRSGATPGCRRATLSDGRVVESTDNLLGRFGGLVGGKTGHTSDAGWSQVAFARSGGVGITAVVLGSPTEAQRDGDLAALLRFGLDSYRRVTVVDPGRTYATLPVGWGLAPVPAVAPRRIVRPASTDRPLDRAGRRRRASLALPVAAGQRVGTIVVYGRHARRRAVAARRGRIPQRARGRWQRAGGSPAAQSIISWGSSPDAPGLAVIVTVTLNAALDRSLTVPTLQLGQRHRASDVLTLAGGKGINVARALKRLDVPGRRHRPRRRPHRHAHRRGADRRGDPQRLRPHRRRVADVDARRRPDLGHADRDQRVGPEGRGVRARHAAGQAALPLPRRRRGRLRRVAAARRRRDVLRRGRARAPAARRARRARHRGRAAPPRDRGRAVARLAEPARGRAARRPGARTTRRTS